MDRILRGPGATIELRNYSAAGDLVDAGGTGNGTAAIRDSAGVAVAGSPFTATRVSVGTYQVSIPSTLAILDVYSVTWTLPDATTRKTEFEIVGSFLFTQAELRALDTVLADETAFPDAVLVEARENTEQRFERAGLVSFTLRGDREYLDGTGTDRLISRHAELRALVSATMDGGSVTVADVDVYPHGVMRLLSGWTSGYRNVVALVEHGYLSVPEPVRRVGLLYARSILLKSALEQSDRATAVFTDLGGYRLTLAGRDGATGIPEVDAVIGPDGFGRRAAGSFA